jgi:excisionase family DNA binding protein
MVEGEREKRNEREILTLREASEFLNCHPSTIYRLVKSSQIPAFRLGGSWRFVKPELRRWIKGLTEWPEHGKDLSEALGASMVRSSPPAQRQGNSSSASKSTPMVKGRQSGRRS